MKCQIMFSGKIRKISSICHLLNWLRVVKINIHVLIHLSKGKFVCVEVLRPSQPNGVMSGTLNLLNHTLTGQV